MAATFSPEGIKASEAGIAPRRTPHAQLSVTFWGESNPDKVEGPKFQVDQHDRKGPLSSILHHTGGATRGYGAAQVYLRTHRNVPLRVQLASGVFPGRLHGDGALPPG